MRILKSILSALLIAVTIGIVSVPQARAQSPFRFGIKAGVNLNELKFNEDAFSSHNRTGFTGGVMLQFIAPIINVGFDASLLYTHRSTRIFSDPTVTGVGEKVTVGNHYIEIPVNLRYNIGLPGIGRFITPFVTTGPDFSFLLSNENVKDAWNNKKFDVAWNFGFGVKLIERIELAASYGLGLKNSASGDSSLYGKNLVDGKNRFWTITAAYLF